MKRAVFERREGLRWFFKDTKNPYVRYLISLDIRDMRLLKYGIHFFLPPTRVEHIKGNW